MRYFVYDVLYENKQKGNVVSGRGQYTYPTPVWFGRVAQESWFGPHRIRTAAMHVGLPSLPDWIRYVVSAASKHRNWYLAGSFFYVTCTVDHA